MKFDARVIEFVPYPEISVMAFNPEKLRRLLVDDVIWDPPISKLPSKFRVQRSFRKPSLWLKISAELWIAFQSLSCR